jgi:hypothetical protein
VSRDEVKRIMKGQVSAAGQGAALERLVRSVGDWFYDIGVELRDVYDAHRLWIAGRSAQATSDPPREPLRDRSLSEGGERAAPIPFHDCVIIKFNEGTPLSKELAGKRVLEDSLYDGVFVRMAAFALQVSGECLNEPLARELEKRQELIKKMDAAPE